MAGMEGEFPAQHYQTYDHIVDYELANIMTRTSFSNPSVFQSPPQPLSPQAPVFSAQQPELHPLLKLDTFCDTAYETGYQSHGHVYPTQTHLHPADFELGQAWPDSYAYPQVVSHGTRHFMDGAGLPPLPYNPASIALPHPTYHLLEEFDGHSPWSSSSPEYAYSRPFSTMDDDEETIDDKPYARLIYEALLQAPGHRMMLREIYDWFRANTTKPQESGTNGWQNSIRHNLSMNKAFENDRDNGKGSSRKATSVWILTDDAVKNGVQSTTRYRKTGAGKRPMGAQAPAIQRQRAGARGGRAARNSAKRKVHDPSAFSDITSTASPSTTSYSDYGDYQSFESVDPRSAARSWPMTPVDGQMSPEEANLLNAYSAQDTPDPNSQHFAYSQDDMLPQDALLQSMRDQQLGEMIRYHTN